MKFCELVLLPITKKEAKQTGNKLYFTRKPCARGHYGERYTSNSVCAKCLAVLNKTDDYKAKQKSWVAKHGSDYYKVWRQTEFRQEKTKQYRQTEGYIVSQEKYYSNNIEKRRTQINEWGKRNRHKTRFYCSSYAARKNKSKPHWLSKEQIAQIKQIYELSVELNLQVDHIVPIKGVNVCGLHVPWNMQLLTPSQNASKGNRFDPDQDSSVAYPDGNNEFVLHSLGLP